MLKTDVNIKQLALQIVGFFRPRIEVDKLILFGSHVIEVVSDDLEKMGILDKIELFSQVSLAIDSRIELKGYGANEFKKPQQGSMLEAIKKNGKIIYNS